MATSQTRLKARDHYTPSTLIAGTEVVQVRFTLRLRDRCKVYMDSYMMTSNGSCFMFIWIILKNHFLEVGLTQNRETMALQTFTTIDSFYFTMC